MSAANQGRKKRGLDNFLKQVEKEENEPQPQELLKKRKINDEKVRNQNNQNAALRPNGYPKRGRALNSKNNSGLLQATINFGGISSGIKNGSSIGPSVQTAKQIRELEKAENLFTNLKANDSFSEQIELRETKDDSKASEETNKKIQNGEKKFKVKRGESKHQNASNRNSKLFEDQDASQDSKDSKRSQSCEQPNSQNSNKSSQSSSDGNLEKPKEEKIQQKNKTTENLPKPVVEQKTVTITNDKQSDFSEISETDSSNLSVANGSNQNVMNIKYLNKPEIMKKKSISSTSNYEELSNINTDCFFDVKIETRIKYPDKDFKKNKFKNLLSKESENVQQKEESLEMQ